MSVSGTETSGLLGLIEAQQDRGHYQSLLWEGSFGEYLELVKNDPGVARNAYQRLYDLITSFGYEEYTEYKKSITRWKFFDDPFEQGRDAVFGIDIHLMKLVRVLRAAALGYGPEKRVLLLHGPVGSAKSTIARLFKKGLEWYSRTDQGRMFTYSWVVDGEEHPAPMNEDPLALVPDAARPAVLDALNGTKKAKYPVQVTGDLNPVCRYYYRRFMKEYSGDFIRLQQHVRVRRLLLSEKDRVGIGTFQPKDEKNQDSTELTGDINYRLIAEYGSDSDPRAFNFDGEFCVGNRGMIEFVEMLKLDVAFLYDLLGASQEHRIKPKKFAQTNIDEVILGHTNEPEFRRLENNEYMEALRDRTIKIDVPYMHAPLRRDAHLQEGLRKGQGEARSSRRTRSRWRRCGPCSRASRSPPTTSSPCSRRPSSTTVGTSRASPRTTSRSCARTPYARASRASAPATCRTSSATRSCATPICACSTRSW
jgi:serine protein kinase